MQREFTFLLVDTAGAVIEAFVVSAAHVAEAQVRGLYTATLVTAALEFQIWRDGMRLRKLPLGPRILASVRRRAEEKVLRVPVFVDAAAD